MNGHIFHVNLMYDKSITSIFQARIKIIKTSVGLSSDLYIIVVAHRFFAKWEAGCSEQYPCTSQLKESQFGIQPGPAWSSQIQSGPARFN